MKSRAIDAVIEREGGYVDHPYDRGGPTKYGITTKVARSHGYLLDMKDLPRESAAEIYEKEYWNPLSLDFVGKYCINLATALFDYAVHSGRFRAAKDFQRVLNVLNRGQKDYKDIAADGIVGEKTLNSLEFFYLVRGDEGLTLLAPLINSLRINHCVSLAEKDGRQEDFAYGWLHRIINLN